MKRSKLCKIFILMIAIFFAMPTVYAHNVTIDPNGIITIPDATGSNIMGSETVIEVDKSYDKYTMKYQYVALDAKVYESYSAILKEQLAYQKENEPAQNATDAKKAEYAKKMEEYEKSKRALLPTYDNNKWKDSTDNKVPLDTKDLKNGDAFVLWIKVIKSPDEGVGGAMVLSEETYKAGEIVELEGDSWVVISTDDDPGKTTVNIMQTTAVDPKISVSAIGDLDAFVKSQIEVVGGAVRLPNATELAALAGKTYDGATTITGLPEYLHSFIEKDEFYYVNGYSGESGQYGVVTADGSLGMSTTLKPAGTGLVTLVREMSKEDVVYRDKVVVYQTATTDDTTNDDTTKEDTTKDDTTKEDTTKDDTTKDDTTKKDTENPKTSDNIVLLGFGAVIIAGIMVISFKKIKAQN